MSDTVKVAGVVAGLCILALVVLWILGWVAVPFQVTSPENVRKQWTFAYQYEESLKASAAQYCSARSAVETATGESEKVQRRSQMLAIEQNYARIQAEYDARLRNAFEAHLVKPSDVPLRAPALIEMTEQICK